MELRSDQLERLLPTLVWAETNLDGDLSLESMASAAGMSRFHFHRLFRECIGETARQYVHRLRLERGAFLLAVETRPIFDIALDVGFQNHETFARAFKRWFGVSPRVFRKTRRRDLAAAKTRRLETTNPHPSRTPGPKSGAQGGLSDTRIRRFRTMHVAFIRHHGDYELVPASMFDDLAKWYEIAGYSAELRFLGIGHDAPGFTPTHKLRFDACVRVPERFSPVGRVGCQTIEDGFFATTTHVGPFDSLSEAWSQVFDRVQAIKGYDARMLPVIEMYDTTRITPDYALNRTELCMPMVRA